MSPILGVWASANQSQFISTNSFESIATVTVGSSGQSSIEFTSIPSTYTHLQLRLFGRTTRASTDDYIYIRFNGDSNTANYRSHYLIGEGTNVYSGDISSDYSVFGRLTGGNAASSVFGALTVDMVDYKNTNKYKTFKNLGGQDLNGSPAYIWIGSSLWMSTSAITSFAIYPGTYSNFSQYTQAALYGIKGA